jgi:hypothetical protein
MDQTGAVQIAVPRMRTIICSDVGDATNLKACLNYRKSAGTRSILGNHCSTVRFVTIAMAIAPYVTPPAHSPSGIGSSCVQWDGGAPIGESSGYS